MASSSPRRWLRRLLIGAGSLIALLYVGVCALMFFFQEQLLYIPHQGLGRTPADVGLEFQTLALRTEDGEQISAWFVPAADSRGAVLYSHGNAGNMSNRLPVVEDLHGLGLDVLIYDYHGFGESTGQPGEQETYQDAMRAWQWLTQEHGVEPGRTLIWGRSLGGGVAVWLASQVEPAGLVVESSFTSIPEVGAVHYPFLPVALLNRHEYPSLERMPTIAAPVLVAHGQPDRVVPYEHGRALFEAAPDPKRFIELTGGHNDPGLASESYREGLAEFLDQALPTANEVAVYSDTTSR